MNTDRNLLFGVLAFQQGVIDADRLAQTIAPDSTATSLPVADKLVEQGCLTVEQKQDLEKLLEQAIQAHHGDPEQTLAAMVDGRCLDALRNAGLMRPELEARLTLANQPPGPVRIGSLNPEEGESRERYTRTHLYAKGGMGQVWLAHDPSLGREIALKELHPEQAGIAAVCSRFVAEARVTAKLEHPGIVPVYEVGEGHLPYYTMRFVKGGTLGQVTRSYHKARIAGKADPVGLVKLLGAFVGVCHAVAYAHSRGFIHRDLKGQNIVLGEFGEVIVLDWGLARRIDAAPGTGRSRPSTDPHVPNSCAVDATTAAFTSDSAETLAVERETPAERQNCAPSPRDVLLERTAEGQVLGTPAYMAPEQAEGRQHQTDARTDVYGLGAILYEILTGQPPFQARTTSELLQKVRREPPRPPRQLNPGVAAALEAVCLKALSKTPEQRYPSAGDLAQEIQRYLADEPVLAYPEPWTRHAARWCAQAPDRGRHRGLLAAGDHRGTVDQHRADCA